MWRSCLRTLQRCLSSPALHCMHYNFCRIHKSPRVTPAMEAGISDHVWALEELVGLLEVGERQGEGI